MTTHITKQEADEIILWMQRDGVVSRLAKFTRHKAEWTTRLTIAAYKRGHDAGLHGAVIEDNPYRRPSSNFTQGGNDPREAWEGGWLDGERIRRLVTEPENVSDIWVGEMMELPLSLARRVRERELAR